MRLISFLGTGNYKETTYAFEDKTYRTCYVAHALAKFTQPREIYLIATTEAWDQHGEALAKQLGQEGLPIPQQVQVPTGGAPQHLWKLFDAIVETICKSDSEVLLDITHGFRMQPFFAAACIEYIQSVLPSAPSLRVVYGEFREDSQSSSPIWELTPFLEVLSWSRNLMLFLRTGQADNVVKDTEQLGRSLNKQRAEQRATDSFSQLPKLAKALQAFSDDFVTIRTGSLLIGNDKEKPSAERLLEAINQTQSEVQQHLPALARVLDQVREMVQPLRTNGARLSEPAGQRALIALAELYHRMGRYSEAISILREGWITLAAPPDCDMPGTSEFNNCAREKWEKQWVRRNAGKPDPVSEIRNDIQHAGFNERPHNRKWFEEQFQKLLGQWKEEVWRCENPPSGEASTG